jgi:hypothetical protein
MLCAAGRQKKKQAEIAFYQNPKVSTMFLDSQAGQYSKKAPVERRERRKRDNPQGLKCNIGYIYNTIFCRSCQVFFKK